MTYTGRYNNAHFVPDFNELNDESYDVDVEIIGTKENRVLVHQVFELVLTLRPQIDLNIRGLNAEVRIPIPEAAAAPPEEIAAKVADAQPEPPPAPFIEGKSQSS